MHFFHAIYWKTFSECLVPAHDVYKLCRAAGHREMVQLIRNLVKESGKKSYTLAIGKPNPAKLANFPEVKYMFIIASSSSYFP